MSKLEDEMKLAKTEIEKEMSRTYPEISHTGGKKLRGSLAVIVSHCLGGDIEKAVRYGAAVEFIHAGTLEHDNILDEHDERRGIPTKMITEGVKKALFIGDLMFTNAIKIGAESGTEEARAVANAMESVLKGAIKEYRLVDIVSNVFMGSIEDELYYKIIDMKTAALFACASKFGALTQENNSYVDDFFNYGMLVGEAYQIADDYVDMVEMAEGNKDVAPVNIIPIIPAIVKYNKKAIKSLPFKALTGRADALSLIIEGIGDINITEKMLDDIKSKVEEANVIVDNYSDVIQKDCLLKEYSKYAINKMLSEVGEKI